MAEQFDIFGNVIPIKDLQLKRIIKGIDRSKTMQELYGTIEGKTCKTCSHLVCNKWNYKNYYKCELWRMSSSEATDIRLKNQACGRYEEKC